MSDLSELKRQRQTATEATKAGPPSRTSSPFFGVGPITDGIANEVEAHENRASFERWIAATYRKRDDTGRDIGPFTAAELGRSTHRGYPADQVLADMLREISRYFGFPKANKIAVGLGGGHSGFTVAALHMLTAHDPGQHVFIDTLQPESEAAGTAGFFRQSWGTQIIEMHRHARGGDESRIHFSTAEGEIPSAGLLCELGVRVVFGVGHETSGATTYSPADIANLLDWIGRDPANHHAVLDATSMLGAMPWGEATAAEIMRKCCLFTPFQKAIGGIPGYYIFSVTPAALALIERNQQQPSWAIPRQFKLAVPVDPRKPLSGKRTVEAGPFYDPAADKMTGGVINTYAVLAFAETTHGLLRAEKRIGGLAEQNRRSMANRQAVNDWIARQNLFQLAVADPERRGCAVTLLKITDPDITDPAIAARILARSKQIAGYEGVTHPDGTHEAGLDVARYISAFPGTPGDYRAWIGGIRPVSDITALLDNLQYAYLRAKSVVIDEELAKVRTA